jgi:hypothetical protein
VDIGSTPIYPPKINAMKQKFKGQDLSLRQAVNSILRFHNAATVSEVREGMNWYSDANVYARELASRYNVPLQVVVGIIAAYSPQAGWLENKRYTVSFLINPKVRLRSAVQDDKSKRIASLTCENEIYNALSLTDAAWKTKAFFLNILNPDVVTDVTIDRHAIAICIQRPEKTEALSEAYSKLTKKQYDFFQLAYVQAAKKLDILPQQLQAITWTSYRRCRELRTYNDSLTAWTPFSNDNPF